MLLCLFLYSFSVDEFRVIFLPKLDKHMNALQFANIAFLAQKTNKQKKQQLIFGFCHTLSTVFALMIFLDVLIHLRTSRRRCE